MNRGCRVNDQKNYGERPYPPAIQLSKLLFWFSLPLLSS